MVEVDSLFFKAESFIAQDRGKRGVPNFYQKGSLKKGVLKLFSAKRVGVITGFYVPSAKVPETDGPAGAGFLLKTLFDMGKEVAFITDSFCYSYLRPCIEYFVKDGIKFYMCDSKSDCESFLSDFKPDVVVSIERPGRAVDGRYYNVRKEDISDYVTPVDEIFVLVQENDLDYKTIAVGDGGNEIGMGNIRDKICSEIPKLCDITSIIRSDVLIVSDISNYGAYALGLGLLRYADKMVYFDLDFEQNVLYNMQKLGLVDGLTCKNSLSVDGRELKFYINDLKSLYEIIYGGF